jgi:hypothetical protein
MSNKQKLINTEQQIRTQLASLTQDVIKHKPPQTRRYGVIGTSNLYSHNINFYTEGLNIRNTPFHPQTEHMRTLV